MEDRRKQFSWGTVRHLLGLAVNDTENDPSLKQQLGARVRDVLRGAMIRARSDRSDLDSGRILLALLQQDCMSRQSLIRHFERPVEQLIAEVESHLTHFPTNAESRATEEAKLAIQTAKRECQRTQQKQQGYTFSDLALLYGLANSGPTVSAYAILEKMGARFKGLSWYGIFHLQTYGYDRLIHLLHSAAEANDVKEVQRILSLKIYAVSADATDMPGGQTALDIAVKNHYAELYQLLIENGADPKLTIKQRLFDCLLSYEETVDLFKWFKNLYSLHRRLKRRKKGK